MPKHYQGIIYQSLLWYACRFNPQWCYMQLPYLDMVPIFLLMGKQGLEKDNGQTLAHATGPNVAYSSSNGNTLQFHHNTSPLNFVQLEKY